MSNDLQSYQDTLAIAETMSKCSVIPDNIRGKPYDIAFVINYGREFGLSPMQSLMSIDFIMGRPALKTEAKLAIAQSRIKDLKIKIEEGPGFCRVYCSGNAMEHTSFWDMSRAEKMQLLNRDQWKKQPATMLRWRCINECLRICAASVLLNVYSQDEAEDINDSIKIDDSSAIEVESKIPTPEEPGSYLFLAGPHKNKKIKEVSIGDLEKLAEGIDKIPEKTIGAKEVLEKIKSYLNYVKFMNAEAI